MYSKAVEVMELWHTYSDAIGSADIKDFGQWLVSQEEEETEPEPVSEISIHRLAQAIRSVYRLYVKNVRQALQTYTLNPEDLFYLSSLNELCEPTKSELIAYNHSEFTSGIDIIKRLIHRGWITEKPDMKDKRARRLSISVEGMSILAQCQPQLEEVKRRMFSGMMADTSFRIQAALEKILAENKL